MLLQDPLLVLPCTLLVLLLARPRLRPRALVLLPLASTMLARVLVVLWLVVVQGGILVLLGPLLELGLLRPRPRRKPTRWQAPGCLAFRLPAGGCVAAVVLCLRRGVAAPHRRAPLLVATWIGLRRGVAAPHRRSPLPVAPRAVLLWVRRRPRPPNCDCSNDRHCGRRAHSPPPMLHPRAPSTHAPPMLHPRAPSTHAPPIHANHCPPSSKTNRHCVPTRPDDCGRYCGRHRHRHRGRYCGRHRGTPSRDEARWNELRTAADN